jgi:hypothetical protein
MRAGPGGIETMVSWEHNDNPAPDYRDILMRIYEAP